MAEYYLLPNLLYSNNYLSKNNGTFPTKKLKLFSNINQLLNEEKEEKKKKKDLESKESVLSFDINKSKKEIIINSYLVKKCNISFYGINTELICSINPFTFNDFQTKDIIEVYNSTITERTI